MRSLRIGTWIVVLVLLVGSASVLLSVDRGPALRDIDEAAWTFNGYFLELYLSGQWDAATWREFDKYAQHPPAGKYLFGLVHRAIGDPMRSMEPRRYWFENDIRVVDPRSDFVQNLYARMSHRQLLAGRYMAAAFAAAAGILFFLLARRFAGRLPALAGYVLLVTNPAFLSLSTLAAIDTFLLALSLLVVFLGIAMGRLVAEGNPRAPLMCALLGLVLGGAFATKIVAYAWVGPVAVGALAYSGRAWKKALVFLCFSSALGLFLSYALDPGLHGDPFGQIAERIAWRYDRLEIQQMLFLNQRLAGFFERACFFLGQTFYSSIEGHAIVLPLFIAGFGAPFLPTAPGVSCRSIWAALGISVLFIALTLFSLPMAWFRYPAAGLPFILLPAVLGAEAVIESARQWNNHRPAFRRGVLFLLLAAALFSAAVKQDLGRRFCRVPLPPTTKDLFITMVYQYTLLNPGAAESAHRFMLEHFESRGDRRKAAQQKEMLERMKMDR